MIWKTWLALLQYKCMTVDQSWIPVDYFWWFKETKDMSSTIQGRELALFQKKVWKGVSLCTGLCEISTDNAWACPIVMASGICNMNDLYLTKETPKIKNIFLL